MKKIKILYWVFNGLFAAFMLFSAIPDIISHPVAVEGMHKGLGYPVYFIPFIGVAKLLGALAILLPVSSRIKEWAYAGLFFDLIGATYSIIAVGGTPDQWGFMIVPLLLAYFAYSFYRKRLKAGSLAKSEAKLALQ
jgi:hypothetical protein